MTHASSRAESSWRLALRRFGQGRAICVLIGRVDGVVESVGLDFTNGSEACGERAQILAAQRGPRLFRPLVEHGLAGDAPDEVLQPVDRARRGIAKRVECTCEDKEGSEGDNHRANDGAHHCDEVNHAIDFDG